MRNKIVYVALAVLALALVVVACSGDGVSGTETRQTNIEARNEAFARAEALVPQPTPSNFLAREALAKFSIRQDEPDHIFYIYLLADTGNIIGYYVAQQRPVSSCAFLSSTEDVQSENGIAVQVTAPSLDGVFYGGGGSSAACTGVFFFDAATDALIEINGVDYFATDQPLRVDAQPIEVDVQ